LIFLFFPLSLPSPLFHTLIIITFTFIEF
jgi:hypothetical protein